MHSHSINQPEILPSLPMQTSSAEPPAQIKLVSSLPEDKPLPINLATALQLADVQTIDVAVAGQRIELAAANRNFAKAAEELATLRREIQELSALAA